MSKPTYSALLSLTIALSCLPAFGQTAGEILGLVSDSTQAVVPAASVTLTNTSTNATRTATTNGAGLYAFPSLVPGLYEIKVTAPGFSSVTRRDIEVQVQQSVRVDITLTIGQVSEAIEVRGAVGLLATEDATVGTVIENRRIVELPLNGRNFLQLVALSPNVSYGFGSPFQAGNRQGGTRASQNMSLSGQRGVWNRYTLDGVENTDVNFNLYVILPSVDALQEFKVQSGVYPAEFGRAASQINVSTKPGTNQYHGTLFEFLRNDKLDAQQYAFTTVRPNNPFKWNQFGYTLGGPVWIPKVFNGKNKLFFMTNYEGYRDRRTSQGLWNVATPKMRAGDFSEVPGLQLFDPVGRTVGPDGKVQASPISGNQIPKTRISSVAQKLLDFYPEPNTAGTGFIRDNYQKTLRNTIDKDQFTARMDWIESNSSTWFGRFSWGDESTLNEGLKLNGSVLATNAKQYVVSNTRTLSPTWVNEFRFGVNDFFNYLGAELANERNVVGELAIPGLETPDPLVWGIPNIRSLSHGLSGWGDNPNGPFILNDATFQVIDNVSWTRGKHMFRFGLEVSRLRFNQIGNEFARGVFNAEGTSTQNPVTRTGGFGFADFMLGYPRTGEAAVNLAFHQFRSTAQYYYIDDTFRINPKLTLSVGLRYEFTQPWWDRSQNVTNTIVPNVMYSGNVADMSLHPYLLRPGEGDFYEGKRLRFPGVQVGRGNPYGKGTYLPDKNDWAPRIGVAWNPTSRWSIRTGFGVFYSQESANSRFDMARTLAGRVQNVSNADFPNVTFDNFMGPAGLLVSITRPFVTGFMVDNRTTYSMQYLLNIQRELGNSTMVEVGYNGSQSRHLYSMWDANEPNPSPVGAVYTRAPFAELGRIQTIHGGGTGSYNGLGIKLQRRFAAGLTYLVGYTWSKSLDTASAIRGAGDGILPNNSRCMACERSYSVFNTPHRLTTSVLYDLPLGKGKPWMDRGGVVNQIVGGWQVGSIITVQSGRTINPVTCSDQSNTGGGNCEDRLNTTGVGWKLPAGERSTERWFNASAFSLQPFGTYGNGGRNLMMGPSMRAWDFSAHKNFFIGEDHRLTFRFEAFNFPNHPNWGNPGNNWGTNDPARPSSSFNVIRGTNTSMRELQFGLKYDF